MIVTVPISHHIEQDTFRLAEIPGVEAIQFRGNWSDEIYYSEEYTKILHLSEGIVSLPVDINFGSIYPKLLSMSLAPACRKARIKDYYYEEESPILDKSGLKKIIKEKIDRIRKYYPNKIALENTNYYPFPAYEHITEPGFITEVIEDNDIYFCFDIAHAIVSANNLKVHPQRYIRELPLHRCIEVHLSTPGLVGRLWRDLHEAPDNDIFDCLNSVMDKLNEDVYVAIEYYRDFEVAKESYIKLIKLLKGLK